MSQRIRDSFIGAMLALGLLSVIIAALWEPVIKPRIAAAGKDAGKGALSGLLDSLGVK
jgi:hypothetical protein